MSLDFDYAFPALVAGRALLAFTPLSALLHNNHQLASPLTSYPRLQEGIYLFQNGIDPYSGGPFRQSPLLLALFSTLIPLTQYTSPLVWTASDAIAAWALVRIWRLRQNVARSPRDTLIAALYLLNPYIFMSTLAMSTSAFVNMLYTLSIMLACNGQASAAMFALALLVQIELTSLLLLPAILGLIVSGPISRLALPRSFAGDWRRAIPPFFEFIGFSFLLTIASFLTTGNWEWIKQTWGSVFVLPDLTPNPGLWWYFFTEMFDHFRPFFLLVFSGHLLIYVAPICIKFQHDMLYAAFILLGILATFKAYPTLADPGLFLSMLSLFPETFPYLRHPIVTTLLHLHASLLLPLFHQLWLTQGTGNANFFYASTLVFGLANGSALLDSIWAGLRTALGETKEGHEVVQE